MNVIMWSAAPSLLLSLTLLLSLSVERSEQVRTSLYREWQTAQPLLKIGYAEKPLKIDPPLITVCLKYLSARATFKHYSLSLGFYIAMENPKSCSEFILLSFSLHGHIQFTSLFQWIKNTIFTADCCFFFHLFWLSCPYGRVVFPCVPEIFLSTYSLMLNNCIFWFAITFSPTKCIPVGHYYFNVDHTSMADPAIDVWWGSFSKVLVTLTVWSLVFSAATLIQGDSITTT